MTDFNGKRILIVGLGKSGAAIVDALALSGAELSAQDSRGIECFEPDFINRLKDNNIACYFGKSPEPYEKFDMLILSPGVPPGLEFIKQARLSGSEVIGEMELAYMLSKGSFAAITGTNGKTTTTALTGEIFKRAKKDTYVVGNIGVAAVSAAKHTNDDSWLVTEVSSFQLETIKDFKPRVSAVLNITPDHLDRHGDMKGYTDAKAAIFKNQDESDYFVVNHDDKAAFALAKRCVAKVMPFSRITELAFGAYISGGALVIRGADGESTEICKVDEVLIKGGHNLENALAATAIAYCASIPYSAIREALKSFRGVPHRLEPCGEKKGVMFINDSKGTNPDAAVKAIEAIDGSIILIAGGYDKNSDYDGFISAFNGKVKYLLLLGDTAETIKKTAESMGFMNSVILGNMKKCVNEAFKLAKSGDTVLLSPACASWDMYGNFEERGEDFKNCVRELGK
jgi:UDP-N-acetylmuramoylalanine--D-glutamate ligase